MRIIGIFAVFVLSLVAIGQGAYLVKLSGKVDALTEELQTARTAAPDETLPARTVGETLARAAANLKEGAPRPAPALTAAALSPSVPSSPASEVLRDALNTSEGRTHLKQALSAMREQERQDRMLKDVEREERDDQRDRDRYLRLAQLAPDEQHKVNLLYSDLAQNRRRVLEEMKAGLKDAEKADDEIDDLEDNTEKAVRTMLGEQRMKTMREAERAERKKREEEKKAQQQARAPGA